MYMDAITAIKEAAKLDRLGLLSNLAMVREIDRMALRSAMSGRAIEAAAARVSSVNIAIEAIRAGDFDILAQHMGPGIIALGEACRILGADAAQRLEAANQTWPEV